MRGNVLDMAIGVIVATAFGKITTSLVNDVLMPLIGSLTGGIDLAKLNFTLISELKNTAGEVTREAVVIGFGNFLVTIIDFLVIAFVVFLIVKGFNKAREIADAKLLKTKEEPAMPEVAAPTSKELLSQILEEIKKK